MNQIHAFFVNKTNILKVLFCCVFLLLPLVVPNHRFASSFQLKPHHISESPQLLNQTAQTNQFAFVLKIKYTK